MHAVTPRELFHRCSGIVLARIWTICDSVNRLFRMGESPVCLHRWKSTVIPGSDFRADPMMTTLLHALQRRGERYDLQTMCEGGGLANETIVERL